MAAYAAIVSLMSDIEVIMTIPGLSNCFENEEIQSLLQKAGCLLEFMEGYKHGGLVTQEAYDVLERQIKSAAEEAADVIESRIVDHILDVETSRHARDWERRIPWVLDWVIRTPWVLGWVRRIPCLACVEKALTSHDLRQSILHMGDVAERAMEVKEKEGISEEEQPPTHPTTPHVVGSGSGETVMVGLEDELNQLLDSLTDHHSNRHVISIVGMGGTGKTTLAQNLYANQLVKEHFDIRAWATVSQQLDLQDILSQLISCIGKSNNIGDLGEHVYKALYGRRYLIVLDDLWDVEAWDKVRHNFPDINGCRSRVVLTTRLFNVASVCASRCIDVNLLDEKTSWKLFCEKALFPQKDDPLQLENVAKMIVKSCKGLALSIVVIGGLLLNSPRTLGYWESILESLETDDSKEKQRGLDVLSLSYNHLPPHLKPCFLYLGVFDEDSRIFVSYITKLWVAEGFIKPMEGRVLEEIAEDYLKDLSDRNLVLGVRRRHTGKIKYFSIHDLVRHLCIKVAEQQEFFHVRKSCEIEGGRRLVMAQHNTEVGGELVRSILGKDCDIKSGECKLLRVLDATRRSTFDERFNLRYLDGGLFMFYSTVYPSDIPTSACNMWNLQTLILSEIYWSSGGFATAPVEIWKMRRLRHIKCRNVYLPDPRPPPNRQYYMENLQTLKTALNLRLTGKVCEIIPNIKKLHLIYDSDKLGYDRSFIEYLDNLDRFHKLESLKIDMKTSRYFWYSKLKLAFPPSLLKLHLASCRIYWDDLYVIGSLPQLQVLRLYSEAVKGKGDWRPSSGQFLSLKILEIQNCELHGWYADNSHFPVLEKLLLFQVDGLEEIPLEIGEIPTLGLVRVSCCSISAAISAVKIKKDQVENQDNDALQIIVGVHESDLGSLKRTLEEEELGLDLFELDIYGNGMRHA